ncbi:MAG: hypothetical protein M1448_00840 [Candidatus Marsarchaeota archaeon]|nr:hypothetical protein [Candidatus Marsarchaeota archaeon]
MFGNRMRAKAQSAMEYLMTYGWAILIIAVVLGALFSLGIFSGSSLLGTTCIASSGYLCQNPILLHGTNTIVVTLGQSTGQDWSNVYVAFVPQGSASPTSISGLSYANTILATGGLTSGQTVVFNLQDPSVASTAVSPGTTAAGSLWVQYVLPSITGNQVSQIATLTVKAT